MLCNQHLSFQQHVSNICRVCYFEIRRISSIRHYLSEDTTKMLLCAFVLSRLDYCNSLLAGSPSFLLDQLQRVQNHAARLISRSSKYDHITPLLHSLHWLPIKKRIHYKVASLCYNSFNSTLPQYLQELLHIYTPMRTLRSSTDTRVFTIPCTRTVSFGQRSFSFQGPTVWNKLPYSLRNSATPSTFKASLKTHLFPL